MLTVKQKDLLDYLKSYYSEKMVFPTFDEMRYKLNIKSKSGIHKLLKSLEEKNYIKRLPHKARALTINNFENKKVTLLNKIEITDNLYNSAMRSELPKEIFSKLIKILSFSVDFQRELRKGDIFETFYSQKPYWLSKQ